MDVGRSSNWFAAAILLLFGGWIIFSTFFWKIQAERLDASLTPYAPSVAVRNAGRRLWLDNDSAFWLIHVRDMIETGRWRIRQTQADNAPFGREVHWSQSLSWLIAGLGYLRRQFTGQSLFEASEDAAVWANPLLLLIFIFLVGSAMRRRWGLASAFLFVGVVCAQPDLEWCFQPLRPDHQSLQFVFIVGGIASLFLALTADSDAPSAGNFLHFVSSSLRPSYRFWAVSGILTGLALWVGATVTLIAWLPLLCVLAFGGLLGRSSARLGQETGWRLWGWAAAGLSLVFFCVEYFPLRAPLRWEVNHPVYALAFLLLGEALARLSRAVEARVRERKWGVILLCFGLLSPLMGLLGPTASHVLRDPLMRRFHREINEFTGLPDIFRAAPLWTVFAHFGLLPVFAVNELSRLFRRLRAQDDFERGTLGFSAICFGFLSLFQTRWLPYFVGASSLAGAHWLRRTGQSSAEKNGGGIVTRPAYGILKLVLLLHPFVMAAPAAHRMRQIAVGDAVRPSLMRAALFKRLACGLRAYGEAHEPIFMTEPDVAAPLYYHARIPTVASYYWENAEGLRDWSAFFADESDEAAARIAAERGVTHVMVARGARHAMNVQWVVFGKEDRAAAARLLAARLVGSGPPIPCWLIVNTNLTAVGSSAYQLQTARRVPRTWDTRFTVFSVLPSVEGQVSTFDN